jgi:hypothetical protein
MSVERAAGTGRLIDIFTDGDLADLWTREYFVDIVPAPVRPVMTSQFAGSHGIPPLQLAIWRLAQGRG